MSEIQTALNRNLILIGGKSASGKTASLMNMRDPENLLYLNCEAGKELPFPHKFREQRVTNPLRLPHYLTLAEKSETIHTVVIDSLTYLMGMVESQIVLAAEDRRSAWGDYAQYFTNLMQKYVAPSSKNYIFLAHTAEVYSEADMVVETCVKVKGSLMNNGIESFFNNVLIAKTLSTDKLKDFDNDFLHITEDDEDLGLKYVFQTRKTKETINERIRGPIGLWKRNETFIDNDLQQVLDHLRQYYGD